MGLPMAGHLQAAGFRVRGYDTSPDARASFAVKGGEVVARMADALAGAECILTMLPNGRIVQDALLRGSSGLDTAAPGALVLEMSSSAPAETRALALGLPAGMRLVDAPVSGGVRRAIEGSLAVMAGGDDADLDRAMPVLEPMAAKVFRCGPVGAGHAVKAINNFVSGAGLIASVEAIYLARAFGLDPATVTDVLNASTGKNNTTEVKLKPFILSRTFDSGFALGLMAKDIHTAATLARDLDLDLSFLAQTAALWEAAAASLGGAVDHTRIADFLAHNAGVMEAGEGDAGETSEEKIK